VTLTSGAMVAVGILFSVGLAVVAIPSVLPVLIISTDEGRQPEMIIARSRPMIEMECCLFILYPSIADYV
jgi:predicted RND superfamily exporter protein